MSDKKHLLERYYREVWQEGQLAGLERFFATGAATHGLLADFEFDPDDLRELIGMHRDRMKDIETRIIHTVEEGDWLSALIERHATDVDTGKRIHVFGQTMCRFSEDGRFAEVHNSIDFMSLFEQFGQLPQNSFALLLTGQKLN